MEISFEEINLRPWTESDAYNLVLIADNKNIADNLRDGFPNPYLLEDAKNWLNLILPENDPPRFFAIMSDETLVGSIGLVAKTDIYRKNIEIGYFISEEKWGMGIATKAIKMAAWYAFKEFDIIRIYAEPFADNLASCKALSKAGFTFEARLKNNIIKNGIIKDSCIYSVQKQDFRFSISP